MKNSDVEMEQFGSVIEVDEDLDSENEAYEMEVGEDSDADYDPGEYDDIDE